MIEKYHYCLRLKVPQLSQLKVEQLFSIESGTIVPNCLDF